MSDDDEGIIVSPVRPSESTRLPAGSELIPHELDPNGDAIIIIPSRNSAPAKCFRVSTHVLSLASQAFMPLFTPNAMQDTNTLRMKTLQGVHHRAILEEDDPIAMEVILGILHFQVPEVAGRMDARKLAKLAVHCDKYHCTRVISPYLADWFQKANPIPLPAEPSQIVDDDSDSPDGSDSSGSDDSSDSGKTKKLSEQLGLLLLAAHLFRDEKRFKDLSKAVQQSLAPTFSAEWERDKLLKLLPRPMKKQLADKIKKCRSHLRDDLQRGVSHLLEQSETHKISGDFCGHCGVVYSILPETRVCSDCEFTKFYPSYCSKDSRVGEYLENMGTVGLWPCTKSFERYSISQLAKKVYKAKKNVFDDDIHECEGGNQCPLRLELALLNKAFKQRSVSLEGLPLCLPPKTRKRVRDKAN
ncbi:hypothetical protein FQN49_004857 [Arthroderma sp. PD_2]|nr:hypothetical protein FQN49_004857 [Arthroderma sp. PD_2]